jgi:hypothetical protein
VRALRALASDNHANRPGSGGPQWRPPFCLPALVAGRVPPISITGKPSVRTRAGYLGGGVLAPTQ